MKAIRIPVFVLAVLLAFSVCNAVHLPRRCAPRCCATRETTSCAPRWRSCGPP